MEIEKAKRIKELVDEISELTKCKKMTNVSNFAEFINFEMKKYYGDDRRNITFNSKYTPLFMEVVDQILSDLNEELSKL